jgi:hypothetical protein
MEGKVLIYCLLNDVNSNLGKINDKMDAFEEKVREI